MSENGKMKPMVILPKGLMVEEDMQRLRDNGICVVECEDPDAVRFMDPPPGVGYERCELAAIELSRRVLSSTGHLDTKDLASLYVKILLDGSRMELIPKAKKTGKAGQK